MKERLLYKNSTNETTTRYEMTPEEFNEIKELRVQISDLKDENRNLRQFISDLKDQ